MITFIGIQPGQSSKIKLIFLVCSTLYVSRRIILNSFNTRHLPIMQPGGKRFRRLFRGQGLQAGQRFGHGIRRIRDLGLRRYLNQSYYGTEAQRTVTIA